MKGLKFKGLKIASYLKIIFKGINRLVLCINIGVYCSPESSKISRNSAGNLKTSSVFKEMTQQRKTE